MDYYSKYKKYKSKYVQLKTQIAGDLQVPKYAQKSTVKRPSRVHVTPVQQVEPNATDKLLRNATFEIIGAITSILLETGCCLTDVNLVKIDKNIHNEYQRKYMAGLKAILGEYFISIHKVTKNIIGSERENINEFMGRHLKSINVDNFIEVFDKNIWPICKAILDGYKTVMGKLIDFIEKEQIPNYKIDSSLSSLKRETTCIDTKCCDKFLNAGNCLNLLGAQKLIRLFLPFGGLVKQMEPLANSGGTRESMLKIIEVMKSYNKMSSEVIMQVNTNLKTLEDLNKNILEQSPLKGFVDKFVQNKSKYGSDTIK